MTNVYSAMPVHAPKLLSKPISLSAYGVGAPYVPLIVWCADSARPTGAPGTTHVGPLGRPRISRTSTRTPDLRADAGARRDVRQHATIAVSGQAAYHAQLAASFDQWKHVDPLLRIKYYLEQANKLSCDGAMICLGHAIVIEAVHEQAGQNTITEIGRPGRRVLFRPFWRKRQLTWKKPRAQFVARHARIRKRVDLFNESI